MAVIVFAQAHGQTAPATTRCSRYSPTRRGRRRDSCFTALYCVDGSWQVVEVWQSKAEANAFYARQVVPHLPIGVHPKRQVHEAHSLVTPQ